MNPIITEEVGGYFFDWQPENVQIKVSHIQVGKGGKVGGEILILSKGEGLHAPTAFESFASESKRTELIRTLLQDHPSYDWKDILQVLCYEVLKRARTGEPLQELWTNIDVPPLEYLIDPLLIKGVPTIIFGEKGVAKSMLSLVLYIILSLPWYDNPLDIIAPKESVKTLILDYEVPGYIAQLNTKRIQEGMGLPAFPLYHQRCYFPLADEIETIQHKIYEGKFSAVIIDSLGRAAGGDLSKDTEGANRFFGALDKLNVTSLILAQTSKDAETRKKSIYGSVFFTYYARSIFELCKSDEPDEDEISIALFHRFANLTKLQKPMGFHLNFSENKTTINREPVSLTEFKDKIGTQTRILHTLKQGAMNALQLHAELPDLTENNIRAVLTTLKHKNKVILIDRGTYGLPL